MGIDKEPLKIWVIIGLSLKLAVLESFVSRPPKIDRRQTNSTVWWLITSLQKRVVFFSLKIAGHSLLFIRVKIH